MAKHPGKNPNEYQKQTGPGQLKQSEQAQSMAPEQTGEVQPKEQLPIGNTHVTVIKQLQTSQAEVIAPAKVYVADDVGTGTLVIYAQDIDQTTANSNVIFQSQGDFLLETSTYS